MTLEETCLEYDRLARLRDSPKAELADYQSPHFTRQEVNSTRTTAHKRCLVLRGPWADIEKEDDVVASERIMKGGPLCWRNVLSVG